MYPCPTSRPIRRPGKLTAMQVAGVVRSILMAPQQLENIIHLRHGSLILDILLIALGTKK